MLLLPFPSPLPKLELNPDPLEFVGVELADDKLGQPPPPLPLLPTLGDGVRDVLSATPSDNFVEVVVPFETRSHASAISAAAVAAVNSSCKFFSYSVCLPCCISSFVKLAASSPVNKIANFNLSCTPNMCKIGYNICHGNGSGN